MTYITLSGTARAHIEIGSPDGLTKAPRQKKPKMDHLRADFNCADDNT